MQGGLMILAWYTCRWTPSLQFSTAHFRSMATFGARVSAADLLAAARSWAEAAIVASTLGATALGYLNIAQRLVWVVQDLSASAAKPISVVLFSRLRDTPDRLRIGYERALSLGYAVVAPLLAAVAVTAPALVPLMFGGQWETSIPLVQALAVAAILTLGAMLDQGLLYGLGRPGTWLSYAVVVDLVTVGVTAIAVQRGLNAVAFGFLAVAFVATLARSVMIGSVIGCPLTRVSRPLVSMAARTALSGGLGLMALNALPDGCPLLVQTGVAASVVVVSDLVLLRIFERDVLGYALQVIPMPDRFNPPARRALLLPRPPTERSSENHEHSRA
jgi:O-antigen/teichoic acid export membrane protein